MAPTAERIPTADIRRLRAGVRALARRFSLSERADVNGCGMTVAQAATLEALLHDDGVRLGTLGKRLGIRPSTLTRNLARLEERGLIARIADAGDGRACCAVLTEEGRRAAAEAAKREEAFATDVLRRLRAGSRGQVLDGLDDLLSAVVEATEACCPGAFDHLVENEGRQGDRENGRKAR